MDWIDKILPVIGVALGWLLSQFGKFSADRKNDKRKLKKLLFNLLELRWLLERELHLKSAMNTLTTALVDKLKPEFGAEIEPGVEMMKPILLEFVKDKIVEPEKMKEVETNIDLIIAELSEIYPVFAYELKGQYRIKERFEKSEAFFDQIKGYMEEAPFDMMDLIKPPLTDGLLKELDHFIISIANKIGRKTKKEVLLKVNHRSEVDLKEMNKMIDVYIQKLKSIGMGMSSSALTV